MYKIDDKILGVLSDIGLTSVEVAKLTGVTRQCAAKQLECLYRQMKIQRRQETFVDEAYRTRFRYVYRMSIKVDPHISPFYARVLGYRKI